MSDKESAQNVIEAYRKKRQQSVPFLVGGLAIVLVAIGIVVLIVWLGSPNRPPISLFATATPTPTVTATATATATQTATATTSPTDTPTATATLTPTAASPFVYEVKENDTLSSIADQYDVDVLVLMALNKLTFESVIRPGDKLLIPNPGLSLDTPTPLPEGMRGTIEYMIAAGDTLEGLAVRYFSTVEAIMEENDIDNANEIFIGQVIRIPVNIATPLPTATPGPVVTLTQGAATATSAAATAAATSTPPAPTATP